MPRYFAFLRAINVGGHTVTMPRLAALFRELRLRDVETFIASGNVVFSSRSPGGSRLEAKIAKRLEEALGYPVATFLRTEPELAAIAHRPPFGEGDLAPGGSLLVGLLGAAPTRAAIGSTLALETRTDLIRIQGRELYWLCHTRQSESAISGAVLERALGMATTIRNINTIRRLAARYGIRPT